MVLCYVFHVANKIEVIMKKIFIFLCTILCTLILFGCGESETLVFYKACLTGNVEVVNKYISQEDYSLELTDKEQDKFINILEKFDSGYLFSDEYYVFIDNPIAVSILGKNVTITKTLCEKITFSEDDENDIIYTTAKMNDTATGIYLYEQRIFPTTYLPFITMIENDNVELFKLFSILIDDLTTSVYKNDNNFLMIAVEKDAVNCVKYLVDTKLFDINKLNKDYQTALGLANYYGASSEIKTCLKNAKGEYLTYPSLEMIKELVRLTNILLDHCDKSKYSHAQVMKLVRDMGYSGTFLSKLDILTQNIASVSEWEKSIILKYYDDFDAAFAKLKSKRMYS